MPKGILTTPTRAVSSDNKCKYNSCHRLWIVFVSNQTISLLKGMRCDWTNYVTADSSYYSHFIRLVSSLLPRSSVFDCSAVTGGVKGLGMRLHTGYSGHMTMCWVNTNHGCVTININTSNILEVWIFIQLSVSYQITRV